MSKIPSRPADRSRPTPSRAPRPVGNDFTGLGLHLSFFASSALILIAFWFLLGQISCFNPHPSESKLIDKPIAPTAGNSHPELTLQRILPAKSTGRVCLFSDSIRDFSNPPSTRTRRSVPPLR